MTRHLIIHRAGPSVTVQDNGRPGYLAFGMSRGGAADPLALAEGAALLGQSPDLAAIEMAGMGGQFEVTADTRIALSGAAMRAQIDGTPLRWNASYLLSKGAKLDIGPVTRGAYGYLHLGGGIDTPETLGGRSAHLTAGLGAVLSAGTELPVGQDAKSTTGLCLPTDDRFGGGTVRVVPSLQTDLFAQADLDRFGATEFTRDARANRMGVRVTCDGDGFHVEGGLSVVSEIIVPGDIQVTGDGTPFVLMAECQTTGGYPRIAAVIPADLARVAQAPAGARLRFAFVTLDEAVDLHRTHLRRLKDLAKSVTPLIRNPADIHDLLAYQLISGASAGDELDRDAPRQKEPT